MRPDEIPKVILRLFSRFLFTHTVSGEVGGEVSGHKHRPHCVLSALSLRPDTWI